MCSLAYTLTDFHYKLIRKGRLYSQLYLPLAWQIFYLFLISMHGSANSGPGQVLISCFVRGTRILAPNTRTLSRDMIDS